MGGRHLVNEFCDFGVFWPIFLRKIAKIAPFFFIAIFFVEKMPLQKSVLYHSQRKMNVDSENGIGFSFKLSLRVVMTSRSWDFLQFFAIFFTKLLDKKAWILNRCSNWVEIWTIARSLCILYVCKILFDLNKVIKSYDN